MDVISPDPGDTVDSLNFVTLQVQELGMSDVKSFNFGSVTTDVLFSYMSIIFCDL